jgi:hypothetical protein
VILNASLVETSVKHAIEDIAQMIQELFPEQGLVRSMDHARGYVLGRKDNVSALHN